MPIERSALDRIARRYIAEMTSIRGRRVHRLLMREFSRFDYVMAAVTEDGASALLAVGDNGAVAVCRTDGRGPAAMIAGAARLYGGAVVTAYDLLKDSLPIVEWTLWHPGFAGVVGKIVIDASVLPDDERRKIDAILHRSQP